MTEINEKLFSVPVVNDLKALRETIWFNNNVKTKEEGLLRTGLTLADAEDAEARLCRFAPPACSCVPGDGFHRRHG